LTAYGGHPSWIHDQADSMQRFEEAVQILDSIGARRLSARTKRALAARTTYEGSSERSFNLTLEALGLIDAEDHLLRFQLYRVLTENALVGGSILELEFARAALASAQLSESATLLSDAHLKLAGLQADAGELDAADANLRLSEEWVTEIPDERGREVFGFTQNLSMARILLRCGETEAGIRKLHDGLGAIDDESIDVSFRQRYHLELARAYFGLGDIDTATQEFANAVAAVELEDDVLTASACLTFDEFHRGIYEAAIAFELDRNNDKTAWDYVQRYKNKLLAELDQDYSASADTFRTQISTISDDWSGLDRHTVLEYTLLEDRIVIWVVSQNGLNVHSVPVARDFLQEEVGRYLRLLACISEHAELDRLSQQLHRWLIEPVSGLIEPGASIVIVPDRILHRLPFAALKSPQGRYLNEVYVLNETPSTAYFMAENQASEQEHKLVLLGSREQSTSITNELRSVESTYPGIETIDGFDITPTVVLDAISGASLLIYAGHSAVDGSNAATSAIQLDGSDTENNVVTAIEIVNRQMAPNALVVL
jgi:hypothetical protein